MSKHTCGGPIFGRKTAGCPRCDELLAGAEAQSWGTPSASMRRMYSRQDALARKAHYASDRHATVCAAGFCTHGDA